MLAIRVLAALTFGIALAATACAQQLPHGGEDLGASVHMTLSALEYALGRADAPLTVVEFTDYQCPYCRRFQAATWPQLKRDYVDTGKVRFIVRDLPLSIHSNARPAAEAAHCAGEQGHFWPMHDALLQKDADLSPGGIASRAQSLGLDMARFRACVAANKYESAIAANASHADALDIRGTPAFIVGKAVRGDLEGVRLEGALPYEDFQGVLNELLSGGGS